MMNTRTRGFTLVELLIVIGLIALLVSILLVSLRGLRQAAGRTDSLSTLRQLAMAHSSYSQENDYRLIPGYIDASMMIDSTPDQPFEDLIVRAPDGTVLDPEDAQSWVWRLAPHFGFDIRALLTDIGDKSLESKFDAEVAAGVYGPATTGPGDIGIADHPAYGLNSIFIGGDSTHGGAYVTDRNPWDPDPAFANEILAATQFSQVKKPARIILFGPTARAATTGALTTAYDDPNLGFAELRPPYLQRDATGQWNMPQWNLGAGGAVIRTTSGAYADGAGLPIVRAGIAEYPVSHLDGSAEVLRLEHLAPRIDSGGAQTMVDMSYWSAFEINMGPGS